jgi:hypothetical protein
MKSKYLAAAAALLCAGGLAACGGGGNGTVYLPVQVAGLERAGLVLQNNGGDDLTVNAAGTYTFPTLQGLDAAYAVTVKTSPGGTKCTVTANGTGKLNYYTSYNPPIVTCVPDAYSLGGTVSGLTGSGLVLANGAQRLAVLAGATTLDFGKINNGAVYGITVLVQPAGQTCSVANGTGTMPTNNVTTVAVSCQ